MSKVPAYRSGEDAKPPVRYSAIAPTVLAALLVWQAVFLAVTLEPSYRGGAFVTVFLAGTVLALAVALAVEIFGRRDRSRITVGASQLRDAKPLVATDTLLEAVALARALEVAVVLVGAVIVLGVYAGMPLSLLWICRRRCRSAWGFAAAFALIVGTALPYIFAQVVSIELWPGVIPEVVPGWVGGGLLPPV